MTTLPTDVAERVIFEAERHLGRLYSRKYYNCLHFVISVYCEIGLTVPFPEENVTEPIDQNDLGRIIFLCRKDRSQNDTRRFTHCGIVHRDGMIHCTQYFGRCVSITPWDKVWQKYKLYEEPSLVCP